MANDELPTCQLYKISPEFWRRDVLQIVYKLTGEKAKIERQAKGKPFLSPYLNLDFNVTHTRGIGICAIFQEDIGVDCEALDRRVRAASLAKRYFSKKESEYILQQVDEAKIKKEFLHHWTAKEASLKLIGLGLSGGLDSCVVQQGKGNKNYSQASYEGRQIHLKYLKLTPSFLVTVAAWRKFRLAPPLDW